METKLDEKLLGKYYGKYVFFYGGYLSNWYMTKFDVPSDGLTYNCSEQHMMAHKALTFNDTKSHQKIMNSDNPGVQKGIGRKITPFDADLWNQVSRAVVYDGCYHKFTQNREAYDYLVSTEGTLLVEASPTDTIWGIGLGGYDSKIEDSKNWRGSNWLGEVLTVLRDNLLIENHKNPYKV